MKTKKGNGLILLGTALILGALGLTIWNMYDENRARSSAETVVDQLQVNLPDSFIAEPEVSQEAVMPAETAPEEVEIPDYRLDPGREMPTSTVNGKTYVGVLSIPTLGLELPVIQQWNYSNLRTAPCRYTGSPYSNDLVIAAHNYMSHFGNLKKLCTGDPVVFTDMEGNIFRYEVSVLETLQPTAVDEMTSGQWPLSLFTCTVGGKMRVTVRCELIGEEPNLSSLA